MTEQIIISLIVLIGVIVLIVQRNKARTEALRLQENYDKLLSQKKSSEVRLGQISEQLAPMLEGFKYDPKQTHFLGMPVDFVIFQPDKVVFLEIKSGKAQLNSRQREIKQLILDKKVTWDEMRIDGSSPVTNAPSELATIIDVEPETQATKIHLHSGFKRQRMD